MDEIIIQTYAQHSQSILSVFCYFAPNLLNYDDMVNFRHTEALGFAWYRDERYLAQLV